MSVTFAVGFSTYDIFKIIRYVNPNKAHGHHIITLRMLQICEVSMCEPVDIVFRSWEAFRRIETANPVFKKNKKPVNNYFPISLLPDSIKRFKRLLYDSVFKFFYENVLISQNQSGSNPGDSCKNQLLPMTHQIYGSFDDGH